MPSRAEIAQDALDFFGGKTFVDMDGVLSDFVGGVAKLFGTTEERLRATWPPGKFSIRFPLGLKTEEGIWRRIDAEESWWENLEPTPWAKELLGLVTSGPSKLFVCSTPSKGRYSPSGKVEWMKRHIDPDFKDYVLTLHKYLLANQDRVLIDDSTRNCERFAKAGGTSILFPRIWNRNHERADDPMAYVRQRLGEIWDMSEPRGAR